MYVMYTPSPSRTSNPLIAPPSFSAPKLEYYVLLLLYFIKYFIV
ncbi:hypothetical protein HMPREF1548_00745 [Clostridium sp. KLE 1755]|nr:hypothetical protein HMPREF1548_00745 [Clostridium sp. KLE 1755]